MATMKTPSQWNPSPANLPRVAGKRELVLAGALYIAMISTLANFLNAGMSSHMIGILTGMESRPPDGGMDRHAQRDRSVQRAAG